MNTPTLTTEHLVLRPVCREDAPRIQTIFNDWEVVQYLDAVIPWPYPEDGAVEFLNAVLPEMEAGNRHLWAITERSDPKGELIGILDLSPKSEDAHRGFWLSPAFHGRGYMSEAVHVTTDYAFEVLGMEFMLLNNAESNRGSHRIKEKAGAVITGYAEKNYVSGPDRSVEWKLTREAWQSHRDAFMRRP